MKIPQRKERILLILSTVFPGFLLLKQISLFTPAVLFLIPQEHTSGPSDLTQQCSSGREQQQGLSESPPSSLMSQTSLSSPQPCTRSAALNAGGHTRAGVLPRPRHSPVILFSQSIPRGNHNKISCLIWGHVVSGSPISEFAALCAFPLWNTVFALLVSSCWTHKILWLHYSSHLNPVITSRKLCRMMRATNQGLTEDLECKL